VQRAKGNDPHDAKNYEDVRRSEIANDLPLTVKAQCDDNDGHCGKSPDGHKDSQPHAGATVLGLHSKECAMRIKSDRVC
jgi:hypothetical protein